MANIFGLSTFAENSQHQDDITCLGWGISSLNPSFATTAGNGGTIQSDSTLQPQNCPEKSWNLKQDPGGIWFKDI